MDGWVGGWVDEMDEMDEKDGWVGGWVDEMDITGSCQLASPRPFCCGGRQHVVQHARQAHPQLGRAGRSTHAAASRLPSPSPEGVPRVPLSTPSTLEYPEYP